MKLNLHGIQDASTVKRHPHLDRHSAGNALSPDPATLVSSATTQMRLKSTVVVKNSFQTFLAEEILSQVETHTGPQPSQCSQQPYYATTVPTKKHERIHILQPGETVWELARKRYGIDPAVVLKYNAITSPENLKAGTKIRIPDKQSQTIDFKNQKVVASWYGRNHHGRLMANGRPFNMYDTTVAHRTLPFGTKVELENPKTGEKAQAVVTDRGPYYRGRDIDLSYGLAKQLSFIRQGIGSLKMRIL
ncbi:MAG: septal ring lytic transglycosylase RlpA family protein [Desulfobulbus sp.]|nr:septal ring lytic transglycosylase RlpA family protein [Desulfobulbus sp.]